MSDRSKTARVSRDELEEVDGELLPERISMSLMSVPAPVHVPPAMNVLPDESLVEPESGSDGEAA